jgi:hypothetical protein
MLKYLIPVIPNEGSSREDVNTIWGANLSNDVAHNKRRNDHPQRTDKNFPSYNELLMRARKDPKKLTRLNHAKTMLMMLYTVSTIKRTLRIRLWPERMI